MAIIPKPGGTVSPPNDPTEKAVANTVAPNDPTEKPVADPVAPNAPTEKAVANPVAPNDPTEKPAANTVAPNSPTEEAVINVAVANDPTEKPVIAVSAPNDPTEQPAAGVPRILEALVDMHFDVGDFSQNGNPVLFDDLFTYSRNSSATFINRRIVNNKPEFFLDTDFVGTVTNEFIFTEQFDNAIWVVSNISVSANQILSAEDTLTADEIISTSAGSGEHRVRFNTSLNINSAYTVFCDFKKRSEDFGYIRELINNRATIIDLRTGVVTSNGGNIHSVVDRGDGWFRLIVTFDTPGSITNNQIDIGMTSDSSNLTSVVPIGDSIYLWGAQITESAKAQPYVKSVASSAMQTFAESLRIEFDPATGENLGALIEGFSTNLFLRNEEFDNASWPKTTATITANNIEAPDKTTSADKFAAGSTATITPALEQTVTTTISEEYTSSFHVKKSEASFVQILYNPGNATGDPRANFDLSAGVLGTVDANAIATIKDVGNGYFRITSKVTALQTSLKTILILIKSATDTRFLSNAWVAGDGIFIWGGQAEEQPFATSHIRTEGSTVARAKDDQDLPMAGNYPSSGDFTLAAKVNIDNLPTGGSGTVRQITSADATSQTSAIKISAAGVLQISHGGDTLTVAADGAFSGAFDVVMVFDASTNLLKGYLNGIETVSADAGSLFEPDLSGNIDIGSAAGSLHLFGHEKKLSFFDEALTAQEVALL